MSKIRKKEERSKVSAKEEAYDSRKEKHSFHCW